MTPVHQEPSWLRETKGWLSNRAAWPERALNTSFLAGAAGLLWISLSWLTLPQALGVWGFFLLALGFASWMGWIKLLGPVLFYDMIRTARQNRYFFLRMLYAGFLFIVLAYMVFFSVLLERQFGRRQHALLAESFFMFFMLVQLTLVVLLTPAYVAGSISDEKERKTIEFMLATDLRNREIVLSKLVSRLGNMSLLLLTGLPILSILQFIGGVDPELMIAGFLAIALTMVGIGSISILFSTLFKRPRDAISLTYLLMLAYVSLATTGWGLASAPFMATPIAWGDDPPTLADAARVLNAGNPLVGLWDITNAISGRGVGTLATVLPGVLERYAWFHLTLAAVCVTWSVVRIRAISLKQTTAGETVRMGWWQRLRPPVSDSPMLWKELFVEGRTRLNWLIWIAVFLLVLLTLGSGLWVLGHHLYHAFVLEQPFQFEMLPEAMNIWFRIAGTFVACLMLLMTGVRASTTITSERERTTFDALITTPMSAEGMLFAKLVGNIVGMKLGWFWFITLLLLALLTGGLHPVAVPILLASCFVYSVFMSMLGLMFSIYCRSSLQAAVLTVLTTIVVGGGHWIVTSCFCIPVFGAAISLLAFRFQIPHEVERFFAELGLYFIKFQAGVTPPFVIPWCSFSYRQISEGWRHADRHLWELCAACVVGLLVWCVLSVFLWFFILVRKFRLVARKVEIDG